MSSTTFRTPSRRSAAVLTALVATVALLLGAALVWRASYSAFSATTSNPTNNWNTGTVSLSDDDGNLALFTVNNMVPGSSGTKCIVVKSTSTVASTVKLYVSPSSFSQTKTVADNLSLTITQGSSTGSNCAGYTADAGAPTYTGSLTSFASTYTGFANGFGTWAPAAGTVTETYQISYTLNNAGTQAATDAMQNGTAQAGFTWEAQS